MKNDELISYTLQIIITKVKIINMEKIFERYELLCNDVKHQISFVHDYYAFDFDHLNETLKEMKKLQNKIKQNEIDEYKERNI